MSKQREAFEAWAKATPAAAFIFDGDEVAQLVKCTVYLAWQASRAAALEEAAERAETALCECCYSETEREIGDEIAFQIRSALKEQS